MSYQSFFSKVNFSAANEDGRSELKALRLDAADRVLCITASGARVLDLVLAGPREIVAIDFNPTQNHLLALKLAGIRELDYDAFMAFLGTRPATDRLDVYAALRTALPADSRHYWDQQHSAIRRGILYCGRWEASFRQLARVLRLTRPSRLEQLFSCESLEEQQRFWEDQWCDPLWNLGRRVIGSRFFWRTVLREPGVKFIPKDFSLGEYFFERMRQASGSTMFRDSPFAWLMFRGHFDPEVALPPHLQRDNYELQREGLERVQIVTDSLASYLSRADSGCFDAFSLSDFSSYADEAAYSAVWQGVVARSAPGARFCERQLCVKRRPETVVTRLARDGRLEAHLDLADDSMFYTFAAGEIRPR